MSYQDYPPPGYGSTYPPPSTPAYPSAPPPPPPGYPSAPPQHPAGYPLDPSPGGYGYTYPPPPSPHHPVGYQGYFAPPPSQPQPQPYNYQVYHCQHEDYNDHDDCSSFLRGCLTALCFCCVLEECCF